MYNDVKLSKLQAEFPKAGITFGYIGNVYGTPGTPAYRDERLWMVYTTVRSDIGQNISLFLDWRDMTVEQIRRALMLHFVNLLSQDSAAADATTMRRAQESNTSTTVFHMMGRAFLVRGAPYDDILENGPIVINVRKEVLAELIAAEEGAYEDARYANSSRPLRSHVHQVAQRYTSRLIINTYAEAEDAYYAVASGTFSLRSRACFNAAVRIATVLKPYASPETVRLFPISGIEAD